MSTENGLDPAWEAVPPQDFPPHDELQDNLWLTGSPETPDNLVFDPTATAGEEYAEGTLGNEETLWDIEEYKKVYGYDAITLSELLQTGWNWGYQSYTPYSMEPETLTWLRPRINNKINDRFYFRDIGISPVGRWNKIFIVRLVQILDRLGPLYDQVKNELDILDAGYEQTKAIIVDSDFPQSRLYPKQQDYAKDSIESSTQKASKNSQLDSIIKYQNEYEELDQQVMDHLEQCFSSFYRTTNF